VIPDPERVSAEITDQWSLELDLRVTDEGHHRGEGVPQAHVVCSRDRQSVFCLSVDTRGGAYVFTVAGLSAAVLRHVREAHCDGGGIPR